MSAGGEPTSGSGPADPERVPPLFKGAPLVGNLLEVRRDRLGLMTAGLREHGDAVRLRMGPKTLYLFNHPDYVKHVLAENPGNYRKGLGQVHARRALGNGLLTSDGELWRRQRRAVSPAFARERLADAGEVIAEETAWMLGRWRERPEAEINLVSELTHLTLAVLGRALLRVDLGASAEIGHAFEVVQDQAIFEMVTLNAVPPWLPLPRQLRFRRARRELDQLVATLVDTRTGEDSDGGEDLLARLLRSTAPGAGGGGRRQLRDELVTLLLAGHETTASTLGWTCYLVAQRPEVWQRLHMEAVEVLGPRRPGYAELARLTYTTQVIEEAMRLYPPVWMLSRQAIADDVVGGYHVPAGSDVLVCTYTLHRHPRFWHRPEEFDPDRFGERQTATATARPRYAYIPFGAGPRFCVGSNLGMLEAVLVLAMIAREFRWHRPASRPVVPEPMLSLRLRGGLPVTLEQV